MGISFIRTIILYLCVVLALRLMGKRQLGELQPSELVVAIMISDIACVPMQSVNMPLLDGIIPIFTLVLVELLFSIAVVKSEKLRKFITGRPSQIIKDGKLIAGKLTELRISVDDVIEQLRLAGYPEFDEVDSAFVETNGQISIIPKESARGVNCDDLKLSGKQTHVPYIIISDGKLRRENLPLAGLNENSIKKYLSSQNIKSIKEVFLMLASDGKSIFIQKKEKA